MGAKGRESSVLVREGGDLVGGERKEMNTRGEISQGKRERNDRGKGEDARASLIRSDI